MMPLRWTPASPNPLSDCFELSLPLFLLHVLWQPCDGLPSMQAPKRPQLRASLHAIIHCASGAPACPPIVPQHAAPRGLLSPRQPSAYGVASCSHLAVLTLASSPSFLPSFDPEGRPDDSDKSFDASDESFDPDDMPGPPSPPHLLPLITARSDAHSSCNPDDDGAASAKSFDPDVAEADQDLAG